MIMIIFLILLWVLLSLGWNSYRLQRMHGTVCH